MTPYQLTIYFAQLYGQGVYSSGTYGGDVGSSPGSLANTGVAIAAVVTVACIIVFVALLVRFWRRSKSPTP